MEHNKERFIRWHTILREQITFVNNLLMTISIAILGFGADILSTTNFMPDGFTKFSFTTGMALQFAAVISGIIVVMSRLADFRATLRKIRHNKNFDSDWFSKLTWKGLTIQIIFFGLGFIFLTIAVCLHHANKLF